MMRRNQNKRPLHEIDGQELQFNNNLLLILPEQSVYYLPLLDE